MTILEAFARQEGWEVPGSRAQRNNNPGNMEYGEFAASHGATHGDPRFAVFPDAVSGWAAMRDVMHSRYVGLTVAAAVAKWAPACENDCSTYVANVCTWTQLEPETILTEELIG